MPDGRTYRLDQFLGLNQIGDAGLRTGQPALPRHVRRGRSGRVDQRPLAVLGSAGLGRGDGKIAP